MHVVSRVAFIQCLCVSHFAFSSMLTLLGFQETEMRFTVEALSDLLVHCVEIRGKFRVL